MYRDKRQESVNKNKSQAQRDHTKNETVQFGHSLESIKIKYRRCWNMHIVKQKNPMEEAKHDSKKEQIGNRRSFE